MLLILEAEWKEIIHTEVVKCRNVVKHERLLLPKVARVFITCALQQFESKALECSCDCQPSSCYNMGYKALSIVLTGVQDDAVK